MKHWIWIAVILFFIAIAAWFIKIAYASVKAESPLIGEIYANTTALYNDNPIEKEVIDRFRAVVTAYSSAVDETDSTPYITADGRFVHEGLIACPRRYTFNTEVRIGENVYVCGDRTALKYDGIFDIWKASKKEALKWGRRIVEVEILPERGW